MSDTIPERETEEIPVVEAVVEATGTGVEEAVPASEAEVPPTVGERLRAAREARGMSAADVALALKLSPRQVEALEIGDWARLPGATFIRGFVRNYARAVQLPAEPLLAELQAPPVETPRLDRPRGTAAVMPEPGRAQKRDYAAVLAGLLVVAVAVVIYFVVPADLWQSLVQQKPPVAETPQEPAPLFPPGMAPGTEAGAATTPAVPPGGEAGGGGQMPVAGAPAAAPAEPVAGAGAPGISTAAPSGPPPAGSARLQFAFTQPSWVEVRDKSGQIIFSQLNPAGSQREVDGVPPFALVVGNAAHVTVRYQGRSIELQPRSKDDVARVTVE